MEYYDNNDYHKNLNNEQPDIGQKKPRKKPNGMAAVSFICGLTGTLLLCSCFSFPSCVFLGVAAIALAIMSKRGEPFSGYAIAGLVFGIISLLLGIAECAYLIMINSLIRDPEFAPVFDEVLMQYEALIQERQ